MPIGELIRQVAEKRKMSVTELAAAINCSRTNVYYLFKSDDILLSRLHRISEVLNYDFLSALSKDKKNKASTLALIKTDSNTLLELENRKDVKVHYIEIERSSLP